MRIGVISDTHDHLEHVDKAFEILKQENVEMVCHLGDWVAPYSVDHIASKAENLGVPLKGVLGNNDGDVFTILSKNTETWSIEFGKETLSINLNNRIITLYHGTDPSLTDSLIASNSFDAVFSGHTHVPKNEYVKDTLALNPGTLSGFSLPRGGRIHQGELAVYDSEAHSAQLFTFPL